MDTTVHPISVLFVLLTVNQVDCSYTEDVLVHTPLGGILGRRRQERYPLGTVAVTDTVDEFLGVPFAAGAGKTLRFGVPEPMRPWSGILNCTKPGPVCPQKSYYKQTRLDRQSEDCLNLNIYTPHLLKSNQSERNLFPVMVFIHGGSYEEGAGIRYDGFSLAAYGVVVVTINYRLGAFGYLTTGDSLLAGNYGLLDQIESLKWVRDYIKYFHGDATHVTLFGSSAGSSSIGLLIVSPLAKGLFHQAILQSGSPLSFWAVYNSTVNHTQFVHDVGQKVGCGNEGLDTVVECLKRIPYQRFTDNHWKFRRIVPSNLNFKPYVDGYAIPTDPEMALRYREYHSINTMMGVVEDEWARSMGWFFKDLKLPKSERNFSRGLLRDSFEKSIAHVVAERLWWPRKIGDVIIHEYTDWKHLNDPLTNRANYIKFSSDLMMVAPTIRMAIYMQTSGKPVYFYKFNHRSKFTKPSWWGCYHSSELDYLFGSPFNGYNIARDKQQEHSALDRKMSRRLMKLWTGFAKHGFPDNNTLWEPFDSSLLNYLSITSNHTKMKTKLRADKMIFWNNLIPKLMLSNLEQPKAELTREVFVIKVPLHPLDYETMFWIFMVSSTILLVVFIFLLFKLLRVNIW